MKRLIELMKSKFNKSDVKQLGRWNLEYSDAKIKNKIDLSNEDYCRLCNDYIINKRKTMYIISTMYNNK
jgi:hypothetical protein